MFRFQRRRFQWWLRQLTDRQINTLARIGVAAVLVAAAVVVGANWLSSDASGEQSAAGVEQLLPGNGLPDVPGPRTLPQTSTTLSASTTESPPTTTEVLAAVPDTTEADSGTGSTSPATTTTSPTVPVTTTPVPTTSVPSTATTTTTLPTTTPTTTTSPTTTVPPTTTTSPTTTTTVPDEPLVVESMTPNEMEAGTVIVAQITGSGFLSGLSVTFSGGDGPRPSAFGYGVTSNRITFQVTVGGGGPDRDRQWVVTVNNPNGDSASLGAPFTVTSEDG